MCIITHRIKMIVRWLIWNTYRTVCFLARTRSKQMLISRCLRCSTGVVWALLQARKWHRIMRRNMPCLCFKCSRSQPLISKSSIRISEESWTNLRRFLYWSRTIVSVFSLVSRTSSKLMMKSITSHLASYHPSQAVSFNSSKTRPQFWI